MGTCMLLKLIVNHAHFVSSVEMNNNVQLIFKTERGISGGYKVNRHVVCCSQNKYTFLIEFFIVINVRLQSGIFVLFRYRLQLKPPLSKPTSTSSIRWIKFQYYILAVLFSPFLLHVLFIFFLSLIHIQMCIRDSCVVITSP